MLVPEVSTLVFIRSCPAAGPSTLIAVLVGLMRRL
jgi:hypothetical protein